MAKNDAARDHVRGPLKAELLDYALPDELIARRPTPERDGARLLVLDGERVEHRRVKEFAELVPPGALLVMNDTRVRRARVFGTRVPSGGRVELLLLGAQGPLDDGRERWTALGRASKPLRVGSRIAAAGLDVEVLALDGAGVLTLAIAATEPVEAVLEREGHVPIPPYLAREDEPEDVERYQTVYARRTASVAAPTAGLHLTHALLQRLRQRGVRTAEIELEVGLGTFRPVTAADLDEHAMHAESFEVGAGVVREIGAARARNAPVVAIGTTVVRALESAFDPERDGHVRELRSVTELLIQPGYRFRVVDALLTNFHQPRSTLVALVAAFAGYTRTMQAYAEAVRHRYRFLSYGDAMWIPRRLTNDS